MSDVAEIKNRLANPANDRITKRLASDWLDSLTSKAGNDLLECMLIRATGREPKSVNAKHGADSADGLMEAKPMKGGYGAHISDDTAMSLCRHQTIPWCVLGVTTKDGTQVRYVIVVSYRIFDNARYNGIKAFLNLQGPEWPEAIPEEPVARKDFFVKFVAAHKKKMYVRSNPLPFKCLEALKPSEYSVWVHPDVISSPVGVQEAAIVRLHSAQAAL